MNRSAQHREIAVSLFAGFLFVALWLLYSRAFDAPFYFDSAIHLNNKTNLRMASVSWASVVDAMRWDFGKPPIYRPLSQLTLAFTYYFFGLAPQAYRIGNLVIHWAAALALVFLLVSVFRSPRVAQTSPRLAASALPLSLVVAAVWSLHPVQTNVVTYVIQRSAGMAGLFAFLAVGAYLRARCTARGWSWPWGSLAGAAFLLGLASKENAVTVLPALFVCEAVLLESPPSSGVRRGLWAAWGAALFSVAAVLLLEHQAILRYFSYAHRPFTLLERLLTEARIQGNYLYLLLVPNPSLLILTPNIPLSTSFTQPPATVFAITLILAVLSAAAATARRAPLLSFSIFWYFVHHLAESTVLPLEIYYEHRLYIPSVAVFLVLVLSIWSLASRMYLATIPAACLLVIFLSLESWGTYTRNAVWSDPIAFWSDSLGKAPASARVYTNLGIALLAEGKVDDGDAALRKALTLDDSKRWVILIQLAHVAYLRGDRKEARKQLEASLAEVRRTNWEAPYRLGLLSLQEGKFEEARGYLTASLEQRVGNPDAWRLLGAVRMGMGDLAGAEEAVRMALRFDPRYAEGWNTLAAIRFKKGDYRGAADGFSRAASLDPANDAYSRNLENAVKRLGLTAPPSR